MRLLFLGDVIGRSGREAVCETLPALREKWSLDFVVVNGENSAGGFGITEKIFTNLIDAGADVVTLLFTVVFLLLFFLIIGGLMTWGYQAFRNEAAAVPMTAFIVGTAIFVGGEVF